MKRVSSLLFALLFLIVSSSSVQAALVFVDKDGNTKVNVLASSDALALTPAERVDLEVKESPGGVDKSDTLLLKKENEKIVLNVGTKQSFEVTNLDGDIVEIEARGNAKRLSILTESGNFVISQGEVLAKTSLPININPKENELSVVTSGGNIFLSVLPQEAVETFLRSKFISKVDKNLEIAEGESGVLTYTVRGEKNINLFNLVDVKIPVIGFVSTTTGEIVTVDQPKWLSIFGFLFS